MTLAQQKGALLSVKLLTIPLQNIGEAAHSIASGFVYGICDPKHNRLISSNQVVTGLATLQSAVQDLSRAYIAHTNTVIGKGPGSSLELLNLTNPLGGADGLFGVRPATPGPNADAGEGKNKRKRAPHDKNAPKRPMTPYFLYMDTARSVIAGEMEPGSKAKEVADEGTRRWTQMPETEKDVSFTFAPQDLREITNTSISQVWRNKYAINLARYREKSKAYKEGKPIPEISDAEAIKLFEEQKKAGVVLEIPKDNHHVVEEERDTEITSSDESIEVVKVPSPPKSPRASKRRKNAKSAEAAISSPVNYSHAKEPESVLSSAAERVSRSPEKAKKKRLSKKTERKGGDGTQLNKELAAHSASSPPTGSQKQEKKARKKRKSEAAEL